MNDPSPTQDNATKFANLLYRVAFFNIFSLEELIGLVKDPTLMRWKRFSTKVKIFKEGDQDRNFYIVLRGKVEIKKRVNSVQHQHAGYIQRGEVFGEMAVTNPSKRRRASAYVASKEPVVVCEIDSDMVDSVSQLLRVKFLKKFLDLILDRIDVMARQLYYYEDLIDYAVENGLPEKNPFYVYSIETAINDNNRLTQMIKYTDFLVSYKINPEKCESFLRSQLVSANRELDDIFQAT